MAALYIRRENGGQAWQVWPVQEVIPAGEVREAVSYLFELQDSDDALNADLLIDDVSVEALRSRQPRVARWRWTPGFHAGVAEVVLRIPGTGTRRFDITTDPDLRKLTRNDFDAMVREVLEDTFALFSLSAFRKGIARQPGNRPPPLARLEFLRSRADEITQTIAAINRAPRHFLRAEEVIVPLHRAARATGPEIIKSFRTGLVRTEVARPSRLPPALGDGCRRKLRCASVVAVWIFPSIGRSKPASELGRPGCRGSPSCLQSQVKQMIRKFSPLPETGRYVRDV